ncbi:hypothetical protein ABZ815_32025 [Nonomuraea sp. NPDC047529]|uniref:hypothetical protein n=1 Tax=Nonomuraea sp. NPDC047529 TaxID=3155623 RepID=UPI0033C79355
MIGRAKLALGRPLGREGQGMVHEELSGRINGRPGVAYKEIDYDVRPGLDVAVLTAMTQLNGRLSPSDAAWLEERAAWPAELVEENGAVVGFLMRTVPQRFFRETPGPSGAVRRLATVDRLFGREDVTDRDRLLILADLADTLARLHTMGVVVGDLSPENVLFTTEPRPGCFLIGCDAMGLGAARALPSLETPPDRRIPAGEQPGTPQGDAYQFALLAIRVFARDPSTTDVSALAAVRPGLAEFAMAALDQPPFSRPMPAQWATRLREATQSVSPPVRQAEAASGSGRSKMVGIGAAAGAVVLVLLAVVGKNVIKNNVRETLTGSSRATSESAETSSSFPAPTDVPTQAPTPQALPTQAPSTVAPTVAPSAEPSEPVADFKVGDCLSGLPNAPVTDSCKQGAPYRVAAITTPSGLCDGTTNHRYLIHNDVLYCLAYQFGRNYCYKWSKNDEFVDFARKCRAPKTFTVRRVLRGNADKDATACDGVARHSWTWPVPALTICVDKY